MNRLPADTPVPAAFVDVDQTLVRPITFLSLFAYDAGARGEAAAAEAVIREFHAQRSAGMSRTQSHRWFYRHFGGREVTDLLRSGASWFTHMTRDAGFFNPAVVRRLAELASTGTRVVLVSGSFDVALAPIAAAVGATSVLATTMQTEAGRYTGEVTATMVGADKAAALRRYASANAVDLSRCYAFGDHHSDIAMFDLVGHPVVVGDADHALRTYPAQRLPG